MSSFHRTPIFWVGLDVHKDSITAAVFRDRDPEPLRVDRLPYDLRCSSSPPGTIETDPRWALLRRRQKDQDPAVIRHAWKCQHRLYTFFHRLAARKPNQVAATAVAREMIGL